MTDEPRKDEIEDLDVTEEEMDDVKGGFSFGANQTAISGWKLDGASQKVFGDGSVKPGGLGSFKGG